MHFMQEQKEESPNPKVRKLCGNSLGNDKKRSDKVIISVRIMV
jgi:hypothetical protein